MDMDIAPLRLRHPRLQPRRPVLRLRPLPRLLARRPNLPRQLQLPLQHLQRPLRRLQPQTLLQQFMAVVQCIMGFMASVAGDIRGDNDHKNNKRRSQESR